MREEKEEDRRKERGEERAVVVEGGGFSSWQIVSVKNKPTARVDSQ